MKTEILEQAIEVLCQKVVADQEPAQTHLPDRPISPDAALKYTQAALNLANVGLSLREAANYDK